MERFRGFVSGIIIPLLGTIVVGLYGRVILQTAEEVVDLTLVVILGSSLLLSALVLVVLEYVGWMAWTGPTTSGMTHLARQAGVRVTSLLGPPATVLVGVVTGVFYLLFLYTWAAEFLGYDRFRIGVGTVLILLLLVVATVLPNAVRRG
jgi:hypothetical protein